MKTITLEALSLTWFYWSVGAVLAGMAGEGRWRSVAANIFVCTCILVLVWLSAKPI